MSDDAVSSVPRRAVAPLPIRAHPVVLGVVLFLGSELMFFASLLAAFYDLRANHPIWPPLSAHLDPVEPTVGTFFLFISSVVMVFSTRAMDRGRIAAARWYIFAGAVSALIFTLLAVHEYMHNWENGFFVSTSAFASIYYAMTGFHLLHVIAGIFVLTALLVALQTPALRARHRAGAEAMTYYWHFVFIVWLGIWSSLFLVPK